jgi:hypothetical protein
LRVDGSHDPTPLPLLLANAGTRYACLTLALEPLHLPLHRFELAFERSQPVTPDAVAEAETNSPNRTNVTLPVDQELRMRGAGCE